MKQRINVIVLAAGKGTRLKIKTPKPLVTILNKPLIEHTIDLIERNNCKNSFELSTYFVLGHDREKIEMFLTKKVPDHNSIVQEKQLGTGHAVQVCFEQEAKLRESEYTFVLCADTPLLEDNVLEALYTHSTKNDLDAVCATFTVDDPSGYGRINHGNTGFKIIEEKDATEEEKKITEVNSGLYIFKTAYIEKHIFNLKNKNKSNEFYLTDLFQKDSQVGTMKFSNHKQFLGINDLAQLEQAEKILLSKQIRELQLKGVRFINTDTTYLAGNIDIGKESVIYPNVVMEGNVRLGENVVVESGVTLRNCTVEKNVIIKSNSYIDNSTIQSDCQIGPMAHIRPECEISSESKIGNFVELKKVKLESGVKISHLSYIGDADVGENTNIGCGVITCNYDGEEKHKTIIGKNCFIGSDSQLIAPITLGDSVYIASGSTINKNVPSGAFAIARQRQETREEIAKRFIKIKKEK